MQRKYFGTTGDGIPVHIFRLESASGIGVEVMEYGASLVSIETPDRNGKFGPIVLGFDVLSDYLGSGPGADLDGDAAHGATLGRYAGRIGDAAFRLSGDLHAVAKGHGRSRLDARALGLQRAVWWGEALNEGVRFHCRSPAGAEGYPGAIDCSLEYRLDAEGELRLDYRATTDAPTVVDLTNQIFFNLNDAGRTPIGDHELMIAADEIVETDREGIPTGHFQRIVGSSLDFGSARKLAGFVGRGDLARSEVNPSYVLRKTAEALRVVGRIRDPATGRSLEMSTTQPGVSLDIGSMLGSIHGRQSHGLCLRPQNLPDAPNHRHFPSPELTPGNVYQHSTVLRFENDRQYRGAG